MGIYRTAPRRRSVSITVTDLRSMDAPAYGPILKLLRHARPHGQLPRGYKHPALNKTWGQCLPRGRYPALRKAPMNRLAGPAILVLACIASGSVSQSSKGAIKLEKVPLTMQ